MQGSFKTASLLVLLVAFAGVPGLYVNFGPTSALAQAVRSGDDRRGLESVQISELMNEAMQVHHTKLWLAARANNWPLASYELKKIKNTFSQLKELIVQVQTASIRWQRAPVGEMLRTVDANIKDLEHAVTTKNSAGLETAYRALTATCNACHVRAQEPQIKIIVPQDATGAFLDQEFRAGNQ